MSKLKNNIIYSCLLGIAFISCDKNPSKDAQYEVEYRGALKNIMHKGDLSAPLELNSLKDIKHLYAIGAVEKLKGEILILDGVPFISSYENNELTMKRTFNKKATLIVYASVDKWVSFKIPEHINSYATLENHILQVAKAHGIDTYTPFPFLIEGIAKSIKWHIINWPENDTEHTHQKHMQAGLNGQIHKQAVELLGFYSNAHHGIFTHHSTNMHLHVKTKDNNLAAHVDALELGKKMILKLPNIKAEK